MEMTFDVVVVGGGSSGEVAAGRLGDAGLSVALVERELVGGECSYWACMPAKALLRPGQVLAEAKRVPGASQGVIGDIDIDAVLKRRDQLASYWGDDAQADWLQKHNVELIRGSAKFTGQRSLAVGDTVLLARRAVVVATGSSAAIPPIEGIDEIILWNNRDITSAQGVPQRMLIIGGGPVGLESAQAWHRLGTSQVVVVEQSSRLLPDEDSFAGKQIQSAFASAGIDVLTDTQIVSFSRNGLTSARAELSDGSVIDTDVVVAATGRQPNTEYLGLAEIGLQPGEPIVVDGSLRSVAHPDWLYAIGDVTGDNLFTHMGKYEARMAVNTILGRGGDIGPGRAAVPRVVFTDPMVAAVGHTEESARMAGHSVEVREASLSDLAEASIWGCDTTGTAKLVVHAGDETILGATFTGPSVLAEMILGVQVAVVAQIPLATLRHVVPQFPTFSEAWLNLVGA